MKKPQVSVILPVYNGLPYIRQAVQSILNQTYTNLELIIIDDASIDNTLNYLKSLNDKRILIIKNINNLGIAKSLNEGIKKSRGKYVARMDADDISLPNRIQEQVAFMLKNPELALSGAWAELIDENGKKIGTKKYPTDLKKINQILYLYNPVIHPTYLAKKAFFLKNGGYDPNFEYAEDYELLMRARKNYKIANVPKILLKLRINNTQRSKLQLGKVDRAELKVKLKYVNLLNVYSLFGIAKKILATFILPQNVKVYLAGVLSPSEI